MKKRGRIIGEFFLIVVGVLVALMVETALDERQDDILRDEYYSRIQADIESDKRAFNNRTDFFTKISGFSQQTLDWLASDLPVDQDSLLASYYAAEVWPIEINSSTYQDLNSTGNISLLDSIEFRTSLVEYYNKSDAYRPYISPSDEYRRTIRGIIPNHIQTQIGKNCPTTDSLDKVSTGFPPCSLHDIDYDRLTAIFEELKGDVDLQRALSYRISELRVLIYLLARQSIYADQVLLQIKKQKTRS